MSDYDLKVTCDHNNRNPYTDISPYLMNVDLPIVDYPNFELLDKERFLYAVRILFCPVRNSAPLDIELCVGDLVITTQRLAFITDVDSFEFNSNDVIACEILFDEIVVIETKAASYMCRSDRVLAPYIQKMVTLLIEKSKAESF